MAEENDETEADSFIIYMSGMDYREEGIPDKGLSDVNILAAVNTAAKKVLLVSTPRDYFIPLSISNGERDKLTHAGTYGIQVSIDSLEMLYGIHVDYCAKATFSGFSRLVDALGGIVVHSDYEFDSMNELGYHFNEGDNELDGDAALVFARERFAFEDGDRQRGRNQMYVIEALMNKLTSPEGILRIPGIIASLDNYMEINMPLTKIMSLVGNGLFSADEWEIETAEAVGTDDYQKPYSLSDTAYVMQPDENSVREISEKIMEVVNSGM